MKVVTRDRGLGTGWFVLVLRDGQWCDWVRGAEDWCDVAKIVWFGHGFGIGVARVVCFVVNW
jgi:hypothetical protein